MALADLITSRFTFGTRFNDPLPVPAADPARWVAAQLAAPAADDHSVVSRLSAARLPITLTDSSGKNTSQSVPLQDLFKTPQELWSILASDTSANHGWTRRPAEEVIAANWIRAAFSPWQIQELMVDFWHNHFSVDAFQSGHISVMWPAYDRVIRDNALGNFRALLGGTAKSAVMMHYLNQAQSVAAQPNENFAREVMELHTLGIARYLGETTPAGAEGRGYSDQDVMNAARILTGWTIADGQRRAADGSKPDTGTFLFSPGLHDTKAKTLFGLSFPAGGGEAEGERFLDLLAAHPGTAQTVATKLYIHFVQDAAPADSRVIAAMAQAFSAYAAAPDQIARVLLVLLGSDEFAASAGQKVKAPFQLLISLIRATGAEVNPVAGLEWGLSTLGAPLFHWPTPNGMPDTGPAWTGTNDMIRRWALVNQLTAPGSGILPDGPDTLFARAAEGLSDKTSAVDRIAAVLLGGAGSAATMQALHTYAASKEILGAPGVFAAPARLDAGLRALVGAAAATPEFQLR